MGISANIFGSGVNASNQVSNSNSSSWESSQGNSWGSSVSGTFGSGQAVTDFNERMQMQAQQYNSAEAQKTRDWQTEMANTEVQRRMQDLEKAGLNPILAYSMGGASVGSGATASSGATTGTVDQYSESNSGSQSSSSGGSKQTSSSYDAITKVAGSAFKGITAVASKNSKNQGKPTIHK